MLCTSGFVGDIIFSHNSELKTRVVVCVLFSSPGGGTGGEVCRLRLHLVCKFFNFLGVFFLYVAV